MTVGTVIWIIILILLLNTTAAIITVFKEKRDIAATWAWLLVLKSFACGWICDLPVCRKENFERKDF